MSRANVDYTAPRAAAAGQGFDPDTPVEGFYRMRLRSGGIRVGIRVWFGQPKDPVTGEIMDRSLRWQAEANGRPIDLERVWPKCAEDPIGPDEYDFLTRQQRWGEEHAPDSALADPTKRADPLSTPLMF